LINKDVSVINRWTRTSTIHYIGQKKIAEEFEMELIANLFNPDELVKEISAWSMQKYDKQFVDEHLNRLERREKIHLENLLTGQAFGKSSELKALMKFEIVHFLIEKTLLGELPSYILTSIADFIGEVYVEGKTLIQPSEWHNDCFYIIYDGLLEVKSKNGEIVDQFETGDFIGEQINIDLLDEGISLGVERDTLLLKIEKNNFLDLITNEYEVTIKLLDSFTTQQNKILIKEA
jgi:AAA family ATP:ADP antiporter